MITVYNCPYKLQCGRDFCDVHHYCPNAQSPYTVARDYNGKYHWVYKDDGSLTCEEGGKRYVLRIENGHISVKEEKIDG